MGTQPSINLNGSGVPNFIPISPSLDKQVLNYASLGENSNKYYIIELQQGTGDYPFRVYTEYGRMGGKPKKEGRFYRGKFVAEQDFVDIIRSKENKGYRRVDVGDSVSAVHFTQKQQATDLSKINDKVLRFIGKLYTLATDYLIKSIDTPLGKLSARQVADGFNILKEIEAELTRNASFYTFEQLSNDFYSVIPVIFGARVDIKRMAIDDYAKLNDKKELLGVMDSVVKAQGSLEKTLEDKYKSLNIQLKAIDHKNDDYKRISKYVKESRGSNHHFDMKITDIFQVEDMVGFGGFNPYNVSVKELFHGTRNENILSIMQSGLKIKPSSAVHSGSMFGTGIYFADMSTKSAQYCWGFNGGRADGSCYLFVCDVATGKMKEVTTGQPSLRSAPQGYNSVMGKKGGQLIHNEYIVYHSNQAKIKYIVEFERN